jgi:hypothetical protein
MEYTKKIVGGVEYYVLPGKDGRPGGDYIPTKIVKTTLEDYLEEKEKEEAKENAEMAAYIIRRDKEEEAAKKEKEKEEKARLAYRAKKNSTLLAHARELKVGETIKVDNHFLQDINPALEDTCRIEKRGDGKLVAITCRLYVSWKGYSRGKEYYSPEEEVEIPEYSE